MKAWRDKSERDEAICERWATFVRSNKKGRYALSPEDRTVWNAFLAVADITHERAMQIVRARNSACVDFWARSGVEQVTR